MNKLYVSGKQAQKQDGSSSDDDNFGNSQGHLLFEFLEQDPPFIREPLADKARFSTYYRRIYDGSACPSITHSQEVDGVHMISLPIFGLASYKFKSTVWTPNGGSELQLANSLLQDADNWLRLHHVEHPDYKFFASHAQLANAVEDSRLALRRGRGGAVATNPGQVLSYYEVANEPRYAHRCHRLISVGGPTRQY
ncbi:hypothetical protein BHM03_00004281 [Ensete ventricosum]|nr:hypothetical protein BHM03_00004281 [Ensete ventricosum]